MCAEGRTTRFEGENAPQFCLSLVSSLCKHRNPFPRGYRIMRTLFLSAITILLFSCSGNTDKVVTEDSTIKDSASVKMSSWRELSESWNASLNLRNAPIMKSFYADSVLYYGDHLAAEDVVNRQQGYFSSNKDYSQSIEEYIDEVQQPDGSWLVRIMKQVKVNGKIANYPASLVFAQNQGVWKIVAESDDITDLTKAQTQNAGYTPEKVSIEGLVEANSTFGAATGGDPKSDGAVKYYALWCKHPLMVTATADQEKKGMKSMSNVERIQVVGDAAAIEKLLNKKVRITGTLEYNSGGEFNTPVIVRVELIEEVL